MYEGDFYKKLVHWYGTYKWTDVRTYTENWKKNKMDVEHIYISK